MDKAIFQNEFAMVEVSRDESANGVRLLIRDLATGNPSTWIHWSSKR